MNGLDVFETIVNCTKCGAGSTFKMTPETYSVEEANRRGRKWLKEHHKKEHNEK